MFFHLKPRTKTDVERQLKYWHAVKPSSAHQKRAKSTNIARLTQQLDGLMQAEVQRFRQTGAL